MADRYHEDEISTVASYDLITGIVKYAEKDKVRKGKVFDCDEMQCDVEMRCFKSCWYAALEFELRSTDLRNHSSCVTSSRQELVSIT